MRGKILLTCVVAAATYFGGSALVHRVRGTSSSSSIQLRVVTDLPAWKPCAGWPSPRPARALAADGRLSLPFFAPFTDEQSAKLFVRTRGEVFDELCGDRWAPSLDAEIPFAEYPGGAFVLRTNSLGMRRDTDPCSARPTLRVLVAGDSHTDGVCANAESFPTLIEDHLRERGKAKPGDDARKPPVIEVLNTGKGSYSFYNYLGVLERFADLHPDVFLMTVYGGNDFEEALSVWHFYFNGGRRPPGMASWAHELKAADEIRMGAMAQGLISTWYFARYPEQMEIATRATNEVLDLAQALCRERGIRLIVAYLPSWMEVAPDDPELELDALLDIASLTRDDLRRTTQLADAMFAHLTELQVESVDLRAAFTASSERLYWKLDCHLALAGHRVVARELAAVIEGR
ncbi:MAG TPA: hypothetical protein VM509_08370 [Planctomycetota bacterium]|nr:hypothetical protein [Planctomycetota bacterium]